MKNVEGMLDGRGQSFAIVVSRFNHLVTDRLLEGALDTLKRHGVDEAAITVVRVPGAFELPAVTARVAAAGGVDGIICLAAVIRGGTPHFEYVAAEVSKGIAQVSLNAAMPVSFGVLTTDNLEQALERAGTKGGNKGADAAQSAIEMVSLYRQLGAGE